MVPNVQVSVNRNLVDIVFHHSLLIPTEENNDHQSLSIAGNTFKNNSQASGRFKYKMIPAKSKCSKRNRKGSDLLIHLVFIIIGAYKHCIIALKA